MTDSALPAPDTTDSLASFAADLRKLRLDSDQPTLDRLAHEARLSRTVISETLNGRQLPSARTVDRIVHALGGEPATWIARRDALAHARETEAAAADDAAHLPGRRLRTLVLPAAVALAIGLVGGGAGGFAWGAAFQSAQPVVERAQIVVENDTDPALTPCVDDAEVAASSSRAEDILLEIVWSDRCRAGWGRVTRYDGRESGNEISVSVFPQSDPDGPDRTGDTVSDVQGVYTNLLVRPGADLICAVGTVTVGPETVDLGAPLCI